MPYRVQVLPWKFDRIASAGDIPTVATSYTTDSGTAVPSANVLDVKAIDVTTNNVNGIQTRGGVSTEAGATNDLEIQLTNRLQGTATVVGATTGDIITFDLGASPAVYHIEFKSVGRDTTSGDGVGCSIFATVRTDGATATGIDIVFKSIDEDASVSTGDIAFVASGNNAILRATGVAGQTISYSAVATYVVV